MGDAGSDQHPRVVDENQRRLPKDITECLLRPASCARIAVTICFCATEMLPRQMIAPPASLDVVTEGVVA